MLALKDEANICPATVPALAKICNISIETCEIYLEQFQQPDKYSRSNDFDGRRIERVDGGWLILNGQKYRDLLRGEERRDYVRKKVAEHRKRVNNCKQSNQCKPISEAEAEAEAEAKAEGVPAVAGSPVGLRTRKPSRAPTGDHQSLIDHFTASWQAGYGCKYPFKTKDAAAVKSILDGCGRNIIEAKAVVDRYLASNDKFYEGHPLTKLNGDLPKFLAAKCNGYSKPLDRARIYSS